MKLLVHTSIIGNRSRDILLPDQWEGNHIDYVCFTDRDIKSSLWNIQKVKANVNDDRRASRIYKMSGYNFFPDYDYYLWIDSNCTITADPLPFIINKLNNVDICFAEHPTRKTVFEEIKVVRDIWKEYDVCDNLEKLLINTNYPKEYGLIAGNRFFYKNETKPKIFLERWYEEYMKWSVRDQLTANYALWKTDTKFRYISYQIMNKNGIRS